MAKRRGPTCGHGVCSQHYIDTGERRCVEPTSPTLTPAEWADYDRIVAATARSGFACADRIIGVTSARVRRAIEADYDAADERGRAILYAERMERLERERAKAEG